MNKKKKVHPVLKLLGVFFLVFIALFIANMSGYYESRIRDNVTITNDKIKEFEDKIAKGENIDLEAFLQNDHPDYSNKVSILGEKITSGFESVIKDGFDIIGRILKSLF